MRPRLAALLLAVSGCVVAAPSPPPRILPAPEAVAIATRFARSRGLIIDYTIEARLDRRARWHVAVGGAGGANRARFLLDGYTGRILAVRLIGSRGELPPPPPAEPMEPEAVPPPSAGAAPEAPPPPPPDTIPPPPGKP